MKFIDLEGPAYFAVINPYIESLLFCKDGKGKLRDAKTYALLDPDEHGIKLDTEIQIIVLSKAK